MMPQLEPLDWVVAGAAAVSLYVLASMWLGRRLAGLSADLPAEE